MGVSENSGTPKSSILIGFSIMNHPFWGTPIFGNTQIDFNLASTLMISSVSLLHATSYHTIHALKTLRLYRISL